MTVVRRRVVFPQRVAPAAKPVDTQTHTTPLWAVRQEQAKQRKRVASKTQSGANEQPCTAKGGGSSSSDVEAAAALLH